MGRLLESLQVLPRLMTKTKLLTQKTTNRLRIAAQRGLAISLKTRLVIRPQSPLALLRARSQRAGMQTKRSRNSGSRMLRIWRKRKLEQTPSSRRRWKRKRRNALRKLLVSDIGLHNWALES